MAFLNMPFLLLFILFLSKTKTQAKLVHQNIEINGENLFLLTCLLDICLRIYFQYFQ